MSPPPHVTSREKRGALRCPARDEGEQCVRDEDHMFGHVGEHGHEWLVAPWCMIGAVDDVHVCDRIEGHEGACRRYGVASPLDSASAPVSVEKASHDAPRRRGRGICRCGLPRKNHDDGGRGGCSATDCKRYHQSVWGRAA